MGLPDPAAPLVLYVDDDESNRQLMSKLFARRRPRDVIICVGSGEAGLEHALATTPQLILLDLNLPGISGEDVLEKLREDLDVPVIVVSAQADKATRRRLMGQGADAFLTKPFDTGELFRLVEEMIRPLP